MNGLPTSVSQLLDRIRARGDETVLIERGQERSAADLMREVDQWRARLDAAGVGPGTVCGYVGDYSLATTALFLALAHMRAIAVPFTHAVEKDVPTFAAIATLDVMVHQPDADEPRIERRSRADANATIEAFRRQNSPGLVVFTSGSSGRPKGILHDLVRVCTKFEARRAGWRTLLMLTMDHFGGVNTLLGCLAYEGVAICPSDRSPVSVCAIIEETRAELLPTTPTFLNLMIASGAWRDSNLSSLRLITYGAEPMPAATLSRVRQILPIVRLKQTYGLSELGVLRSQSPQTDSLWLRIGGDGFETKVVDGILNIRSASSMVGYLNAPSPIDAEGWMSTGDIVEERDGLIRFLGRHSEIINVGGQKVFPAEVEAVLLEHAEVADAEVSGSDHPLLGQAVVARIGLVLGANATDLNGRLREHCRARLEKYKVPLRFTLADPSSFGGARAKKLRSKKGAPDAGEER